MGPIAKERFRILADFGRHETASDADSVRMHIRDFHPHLFVPESAFLPEESKPETIRKFNHQLERSRISGKKRRNLLGKIAMEPGLFSFGGFGAAQMDAAISSPGLRMYFAEFVPEAESAGAMWGLAWTLPASAHSVAKLSEGDTDAALDLAVRAFLDFGNEFVLSRNKLAARGFERLCQDVPEYFPELAPLEEIRVLTRYGLAHLGMADDLDAAGFRVELPGALPEPDFRTEILLRIGKDPSYTITREDSARILFQNVHDAAFPDSPGDFSGETERLRRSLAELGGEDGFLLFAARAASAGHPPDHFLALVRARLGEAAAACR